MKKFLYIVLVNIAVFTGLLIFLELLIRLFFPQIQIPGTDRNLFIDSVYYDSAGLLPNAKGSSYGIPLQVDNNGFWKFSKKAGNGKRILYIGDSITMGIGVESDSTFAGIINDEENVPVLNSAMIGYSSKDYLNIVKKVIVEDSNKLNITGVSLFWCLNDVYDYYPYDTTPEFKPDGILGGALTFFKKNFKLFYFIKNSFTDRQESYYLYDEKFYRAENEFFRNSLENLVKIAGILEKRNIPFEIFLFPYEYQLRGNEKEQVNPQELLADSLSNYDISVHNLTSSFKSVTVPGDLYLYGDGIHFSNSGHRVAAEYIKSTH
ncbi:MAG: SGNH/GDSL hydrolase family protein [Ignavibacteriaceae bacterium]